HRRHHGGGAGIRAAGDELRGALAMSARRQVCILGSTGTIGVNTLRVIAAHPDSYEVFALTAHSRADALREQCLRFRPRYAVLGDEETAAALRAELAARGCATEVLAGTAALCQVA